MSDVRYFCFAPPGREYITLARRIETYLDLDKRHPTVLQNFLADIEENILILKLIPLQ